LAEVAGGESQSGGDRWRYVQSGLVMWWQHPWGGTGAGTYGDVHPHYQQRVVSASTDAHNLYVQVLAELGLAGAILLVGVLLWLVVGVARGVATEPSSLAVVLGAMALLLHFGLDIDPRYPALLALAAVLLGLVYRQHRDRRGAGQWWPVAVAVAVLVPAVSLYQSGVWAQRAAADQQDGDYDLAAERYDQAHTGVLFNPDYVNAAGINWYALGTLGGNDARADLATALERARAAERLDPHDGQHHQLEGRVLVAQGDARGAERAFRAALQLDSLNHPDYALDLANLYVRAGNKAAARTTAQTMLDLYPDKVVENRSNDPLVRPTVGYLAALVGNLDLQAGRLDAAEAAGRRALRVDPKNLQGRALLHQVELARQGKLAG
jgi:tetratricopeptide (TPR) repeat protein